MKLKQRIKCLIKSNRGDALVVSVVVIMVIMMLFFCLYELQQNIATIGHVRDTSKIAFDIYTTTTGKDIVSSIKSGHDYTVAIKESDYIKQLKKSLGITNDELIAYNDSKVRFKITDVKASYIIDKELKTQVRYMIHVPYYFFGIEIVTLSKPVTVECRYNLK